MDDKNKTSSIRIKRGLKIKVIDFKERSKRDKDFANCVGMYEPEEKTAYISNKLPEKNKGTRKLCEAHETVHHRLRDIESYRLILPNLKLEEDYVELEAIARTKDTFLTYGERYLKKILTDYNELNPNKKEDLLKIIKNILKVIKVKSNKKLLNELLNVPPEHPNE